MDSDSPAVERTAAEQPTLAGARSFSFGGTFGTFSEFGSPFTRLAVGTATAGSPRHRRHRVTAPRCDG